MNSRNKNIEFLLEKLIVAGFLLFIVFVFKNSGNYTFETFKTGVSIEQTLEINQNAIPVDIFSVDFTTDFQNSVFCNLSYSDKKFNLNNLNDHTNLLYRISKDKFNFFKPQITYFQSNFIRSALNSDDPSLLS